MPNTFISLNVPNTDTAGAPAITSLTGSPKTFVFAADAIPNGRYIVEGSNDGGVTWDIIVGLDGTQVLFASNNTAGKSVEAVVDRVRVRSVGNGPVALPPSITMAAPPAPGPSIFGVLNVPTAEGLGNVTDLGASAGPVKTFIVRGDIRPGSRFTILASLDGSHFEPAGVFTADQEGALAISILCRFLRVQRHGTGATPSIAFGSQGTFDAAVVAAASSSLAIDEDEEHETTTTTDEEILVEYSVPLATLSAPNLSVSFAGINVGQGEFGSSATYRVLLGGAFGVPAGLEIAKVIATPAAGDTSVVVSGPSFVRPDQPSIAVKVTGRGSGAARAVLRGFVLLFHAADQSTNQGGVVMSKDVAQRDLDMAGFHILNVGNPQGPADATHVDGQSVPLANNGTGSPGQSFLAAPADHVHPATGGGGGGTSAIEPLQATGLQSTSGIGEEIFEEWFVDFDAEPSAQIVAEVSGFGKGSGSMNVRVGGTPGGVDGTLAATVLLADAGTFHAVNNSGAPFNKPNGVQPVVLSAIAPAAGIPITARGKLVTLRGA